MEMAELFAREILPDGTWNAASAIDRITLDYEGRHRRRYRYVADGGLEFVLDLKQTTLLHDGDGLPLRRAALLSCRRRGAVRRTGAARRHRQSTTGKKKSPGGFPPGLSVRSLDRTYQLR